MSIYNIDIKTSQGKDLDLSDYKGKTVLIVNTATKCGLAPQFSELEELHQKYKQDGLVVLGCPSNQFLNQEPETNETMAETCKINHGVSFQLTEKIKVNGKDTHPLFKYLKKEKSGWTGGKIKWNFTKFLVSPEGKAYKRYAPTVKPSKIEKDIRKLLKK
jgi:glutathione peroxidase